MIETISAPCANCETTMHHGTRHSMKTHGNKVVLRCSTCGGGWSFDAPNIPVKAPRELFIQSCVSLIVNGFANMLPPHPRVPDKESS